ncbi:nuclear receptor-binding protein 2-like [Sinocyclocheilus grahami]|uniref:nuclear receptor-binding protein 2-like n=1 Tax=Sinocyclocheilus grahami TaxID=75366 RepID=UPI0007ACB42A|nr:PREDICTED: nuclear receptor-binding protein 2-like [Sinocyclocheilus grahami]
MTMSVPERNSGSEKEEESEDESEIVEESPCGRWQKRKEQVSQGNVPGVESASLAMDTEEGVEVVWNEVLFHDKKVFKTVEDKMKEMFENLMQVDHPNIVKFHKYWLDIGDNHARVTHTETHCSQLLYCCDSEKKKRIVSVFQAWKRWCTQILSALSYLHSCDPPIIHGNLTCDTIFIQHNGLIKIGSVWHRLFVNVFPEGGVRGKLHQNRDDKRNLHFFSPEYGSCEDDYAIDIFSFGICALEMAVLEIQANGDSVVSKEAISNAGQSLEDPLMREFTQMCVRHNPRLRPTAHDLLFHRVLFEVHSLKLLAAHCLINNQYMLPENSLELDKFLEDVKNGIYPLMNFASTRPHPVPRALSMSQEQVETVKTPTPEPQEAETRKVVQMHCNLESNEDTTKTHLTLFLKLDDKLHRQLSCDIMPNDSSRDLVNELIHHSFISEEDGDKIVAFLEEALSRHRGSASAITTI